MAKEDKESPKHSTGTTPKRKHGEGRRKNNVPSWPSGSKIVVRERREKQKCSSVPETHVTKKTKNKETKPKKEEKKEDKNQTQKVFLSSTRRSRKCS